MIKNNKKTRLSGFTLIEMLVVVLIIGILAAVALPQYKKSVEKTRVVEALINIKAIEGSMQRYVLAKGFPTSGIVYFKDFADIELSGGDWDEYGAYYNKEPFEYNAFCEPTFCHIEVTRYSTSLLYELSVHIMADEVKHECWTTFTDMGEYICKYLESQGWEYVDNEF